jgi:long-chain acyl-CoA synthetase
MSKEPTRLFDLPKHQREHFPQEDALAYKVQGEWVSWSTDEFIEQADRASKGMIAIGMEPGDHVAIISENRPEWNIVDIGVLQAGGVDVPIYPTISEDDQAYIFNHAEIKYCFVSNEELYQKVLNIQDQVPSLQGIYSFDPLKGVTHWTQLLEAGNGVDMEKVEKIKDGIGENDLATMIYTSGTTGRPKGVMLSHRNLVSNVRSCVERLPVDHTGNSLSFLPASHVYERMILYLYMYTGVSIYFAESIDTIGDNLREVKPQVFTAVPRLLEKVFDKIMAKGYQLKGIQKALFFWAVRLGEQYEPRGGHSAWYRFKLAIARKLIFKKWYEAIGGNAKAIASGSAPLQPRLIRIFLAAGVPVMEGYGLTETSPVIAVNCEKNNGVMVGTVGRPLADQDVRIADDGEILVKGPNVMMGYYKNEEETRKVMDDEGFFYTGDIGELVNGEFLKITDRKKQMFKTSGGKYIAPGRMENKFKESPFIEHIMVIGEGRKFPAALVVPAFEHLKEWCQEKGIEYTNAEEMVEKEEVQERIRQEIDEKNKAFGHWEWIKRFILIPKDWTIEGGELTPTLKVKRKVIQETYTDRIEGLYNGTDGIDTAKAES